jgi:hypothetical protein
MGRRVHRALAAVRACECFRAWEQNKQPSGFKFEPWFHCAAPQLTKADGVPRGPAPMWRACR